jgi:hypothetical protein
LDNLATAYDVNSVLELGGLRVGLLAFPAAVEVSAAVLDIRGTTEWIGQFIGLLVMIGAIGLLAPTKIFRWGLACAIAGWLLPALICALAPQLDNHSVEIPHVGSFDVDDAIWPLRTVVEFPFWLVYWTLVVVCQFRKLRLRRRAQSREASVA